VATSTRIFLVGYLCAPFFLSGCTWLHRDASASLSSPVMAGAAERPTLPGARSGGLLPKPAQPESLTVPATADSAFAQCRRELNSLRLITPAAWNRRKAEFDQLVSRASVYARVRGDINGQTQDVVDALYQYQTRQLCIRIQRDVVDGLMLRAGNSGGQAG